MPRPKGCIPWNRGKKTGQITWMKGKHHSKESLEKMSASLKGKTTWMKGKKHSDESRKKISEAAKRRKQTEEAKKKIGAAAKGNKYALLRKKHKYTSIEIKLYKELKIRNIPFEKQYLINDKFLVDAFIPSLNVIIEADGIYWHGLDNIKKKDKAENAYLLKCGYKLLRISETQINNGEFKQILDTTL